MTMFITGFVKLFEKESFCFVRMASQQQLKLSQYCYSQVHNLNYPITGTEEKTYICSHSDMSEYADKWLAEDKCERHVFNQSNLDYDDYVNRVDVGLQY